MTTNPWFGRHDHVREIYKSALDKIPKEQAQELFKSYTIYEKKYAGVESVIVNRSKYQYEREVKANPLNYDSWFGYLRLMESEGNIKATRKLYKRAISNVPLYKVWISFARFELGCGEGRGAILQARRVYEKANKSLRTANKKEECMMLLELWKEFEEQHGSEHSRLDVEKQMPKKVKKRRRMQTDDGTDGDWEEYYDYIFPSDEVAQPYLQLLEIIKELEIS